MMYRYCLTALLLLTTTALVGCGEDSNSSEPSQRAGQCTPDPELIDRQQRCQVDDDCPCGTSCQLGQCSAQCLADEECDEGQVCDSFGRCRDAADAERLRLPPSETRGGIALEQTQALLPVDGEISLTVRADQRPIDRVRVHGDNGAQVKCPEADTFDSSCEIADLGAGDAVEVSVRRDPEADPAGPDVASISVHGPSNFESASLPRLEQRRQGASNADQPAELSGHYSGTLTLKAAGTDADLGDLPDAPAPASINVDAAVWEADGQTIVAIDDPYGALTSADQFIGTLAMDEDDDDDGLVSGEADFVTHPFVETTVAGQREALVAQTVDTEALSVLNPRRLSLAITQSYRGHGTEAAPTVRWMVELSRTEEISQEAPALPQPAELGFDPAERLDERAPWEAAFTDATETEFPRLTLNDWPTELEADARRCGYDEAARVEMQRLLNIWWLSGAEGVSSYTTPTHPIGNVLHDSLPSREVSPRLGDTTQLDPVSGWEQTDTPDLLSDGIICAATGFDIGDGSYHSGTHDFDYCDQLSDLVDCQPLEVDEAVDFTMDIQQTIYVQMGDGTYDVPYAVTGQITGICRLPGAPASCGEQISCLSGDDTSETIYQGALFSEQMLDPTGDLACANSDLSAGIALDRQADDLSAQELLDKCMPELATLSQATPSTGGSSSPDALFDVDAECIDVGRMLTSLAVQARPLSTQGAKLPPEAGARAGSYAQRLLTRWVELHGFIASETIELEQMADVFRAADSSAFNPRALDEMFEASVKGWDLFLKPNIANTVLAMPGGALVEPDYRHHRFGLAGNLADEQKRPLSEMILEALGRQSELLRLYIEKEGTHTEPDALNPLAELMPRMLVAQAMAADMTRRAHRAEGDLSWADRYEASAQRVSAKLAGAMNYFAAVSAGANPLGIEDADLPLYFLADDASGDGGRFSAISDYIAGDGPGSDAWAPAMVDRAQDALEAARQAYLDESDRQVRTARNEAEMERWVDEVRDEYNATLRDYCGPLTHSVIDDPSFDAATCAVNRSDPACSVDHKLWYSRWTEQDLLGRLCLHNELDQTSLADDYGFFSSQVREFASSCYVDQAPESGAVSTGPCAADSDEVCLRCDWDPSVDEVELQGATLELVVPNPDQTGVDEPSRDGSNHAWLDARAACDERHPQMRLSVPRPDDIFETPGCVRGALGEAYLDVEAASGDIEAARQAINEHHDAYGIAMESCFILEEGNDEIDSWRESHSDNMQRLRIGRTTADAVATTARAVKECSATIAGSSSSTPWGAIKGTVAAATSCAAGGFEAAAEISSAGIDAEMERAQASHEDDIASREADIEVDICFNDAKQELLSLKAATMDLETAVFELERAQARLDETIAEAQLIYDEGHAHLKKIESQSLPDAAGDVWANERVSTYVRDFTLARRAAYLAVRAVEYEYQQNLGARQDVLDAKVPADLQTVLQNLWTASGTRSIDGNRPIELTEVVSLRDDILRLGDESAWPDAMRPMSPAERFQLVLSAERYAVYDDDGAYEGQRIPFKLAPRGAFDFETGGVSIYAESDCAERLWSVNAGLVGENLYRGSETTVSRIDLLKRNTFYSQWCDEPGDGQNRFQTSSVRPSRNLFREAGFGEPEGIGLGESSVEQFSRARIQAFFGVDHTIMEDPEYANGETSELAARGLYGDYALFIPAALISRDGSNGLVLDNVEDILLRVDYLSVAAD